MGVPRSSYYAAPAVADADTALVAEMRAITDAWECYGYRRIGAELRHRGWIVNAKKLRRLMKLHDLNPRRRRRFPKTTDSDYDGPIYPVIARGFARRGWLVNDLHRHVVSHLAYLALVRLVRMHRIVPEDATLSLAHSFRPANWRALLRQAGVAEVKAPILRSFPFWLCV